jgi:hypothetical protein
MGVTVAGRTGRTGPRGRRVAGRLAAATLTGGLLLAATAGPALADDRTGLPSSADKASATTNGTSGTTTTGTVPTSRPPVVPLIDCATTNDDGSWTVVFGYDNRGQAPVAIPQGAENKVTPSPLTGSEPTSFRPGVQHAVLAVRGTNAAAPTWQLDGTHLVVRKSDAPECTAATALPATGNGTGPVIALVTAGVLGAVLLRRVERRRSGSGAASTATSAAPAGAAAAREDGAPGA